MRTPADSDTGAAETQSVIPDFISSADEINVEQGVRHCGDEDIYLKTLMTYAETLCDNADSGAGP